MMNYIIVSSNLIFQILQINNYYLLQVRTLFVSGLPMDTKPRELYLLFRAYEVQRRLKSFV